MKIKNKRIKGGPHPIHLCPCGTQINTQAKPKVEVDLNGFAYCKSDCGARPARPK